MSAGRAMPAAAPLTLKRYGSLEDIGQEAWDELASRSAGATFFQGWAWNAAWWSTRQDPVHRLVLLAVSRRDRLVALAPLHLGEPNAGRGRALSFLGQGNSDYQDFLVDREEPEALGLLLDAIASLDEPWQRLLLYEIPEGSTLRTLLEEADRTDRLRLVRRPDTLCPRFDATTDPEGFARLAEKQSLKRNAAHLRRIGNLDVEHLYDATAIERELPSFFRQHTERWAFTRTPSLFLDPAARSLYATLVRLGAPRGEVLLTIVRLNGRPVAYHLGFVHSGRLVWYKPSFDIRYHRMAPGQVLLQATIRHAVQIGLREFDMTRGNEAYKSRFANGVRRNANWLWFRDRELERRFVTANALREALRRPLNLARGSAAFVGYVEMFDDAWRGRRGATRSLPSALRLAARGAVRDVLERHLFARCEVRRSGGGGAEIGEATLDALLEGADLRPDAPRTAALADSYRRLREGGSGLVLYRNGCAQVVLWFDTAGRVDRVRSLNGPPAPEDVRELLRAASARTGRPEGTIEVRLEGDLDRRTLELAGIVVTRVFTEWRWFEGRNRRAAVHGS